MKKALNGGSEPVSMVSTKNYLTLSIIAQMVSSESLW